MDVNYHVKFQPCITSGSKVSRGVQNCTPLPGIECVQTPPVKGLKFNISRFWRWDMSLCKRFHGLWNVSAIFCTEWTIPQISLTPINEFLVRNSYLETHCSNQLSFRTMMGNKIPRLYNVHSKTYSSVPNWRGDLTLFHPGGSIWPPLDFFKITPKRLSLGPWNFMSFSSYLLDAF